jgi:aminobenzoyl-glutamate utilization protein A
VETRGESEAINQYVFERAQAVITGAAALYGVSAEMRLMGAATSSAPTPAWGLSARTGEPGFRRCSRHR